MARFEYQVIINNIVSKGDGNGFMKPDMVVIHHSAVVTEGNIDILARLNQYATNHIQRIGNPGLAYHVYIPTNEDNVIYITRYLNQIQWHCSNGGYNRHSIGVLVEGNFEVQKPSELQLKKLRQLLDDLDSGWFQQNGWSSDFANIKPKDNQTQFNEFNKRLTGKLCYHNEAAENGYGTACCGKNLIPYVVDYRNTAGNVSWGGQTEVKPPTTPTPPPVDECESRINMVAGNLNSKITDLEGQLQTKTSLVDRLTESLQRTSEENGKLFKQTNELLLKVAQLEQELKKEKEEVVAEQPKTLEAQFMKLWTALGPRFNFYFPYVSGFIGGLIAILQQKTPVFETCVAVVGYIITTINTLKAVDRVADKQKKEVKDMQTDAEILVESVTNKD